VVDNASRDNSVQRVKDEFPDVRLITNNANAGFAKANNQAVKVSTGRYLFFLNPDTALKPGALQAVCRFMDAHPDIGLAGTRIVNPDGSPQPSVEKQYPGERYARGDLKNLKGEIAWVLGASMIIRREIFEKLKGFDEAFFLYGEEQDLCLRVRKAGFPIGFISDAVVIHWGGQSEKEVPSVHIWNKKLDAEFVFYKKHYSDKAIKRIRLKNFIQALWRILTLRITICLLGDKERAVQKLEKYRLVFSKFRNWA
jgi:GT2 family glycosyltransferase